MLQREAEVLLRALPQSERPRAGDAQAPRGRTAMTGQIRDGACGSRASATPQFRTLPGSKVLSLHAEATVAALADAGLDKAGGDGVVCAYSLGEPRRMRRALPLRTGASGDEPVTPEVLARAGAIEAGDIEQLPDLVYSFARGRRRVGTPIGIVTNSAGLGVIVSDVGADLGLDVPCRSDMDSKQRSASARPAIRTASCERASRRAPRARRGDR